MAVVCSKDMKEYFDEIDSKIKKAYTVAGNAREKGYDPSENVEIQLARNLGERVEGLVSVVMPQVKGSGIVDRLIELEKKFGLLDWRVGLTIGLEVAQEKFCKFDKKLDAMETGVRVGLAYVTLGVLSSPLEGFVRLKIRKRSDGKDYLAAFYSGPIRSAGGTMAAVSVLIVDYIGKSMGFSSYDPSSDEVKRTATELYDYHERVTNLQYLPSEQEIEFLASKIPVQVDGDASEDIEVSNYKDLPRVETNKIRNGVCLVMGEGIAQKAVKIVKQLNLWGKDFGLENWEFMGDFVKLQRKIKSKGAVEDSKVKIVPDYTFIKDVVAGRPVLTYPLRAGGFRLRYGRTRTSGFSSMSMHPASMVILDDYIATGTQLKYERPGKSSAMAPCDSIEGPIVRLENGEVLFLDTAEEAKKFKGKISEILFMGDYLVNYAEFYHRGHRLVPAGYCEEWYKQDIKKAMIDKGIKPDEVINRVLENSSASRINCNEAIDLAKRLGVPLHPRYTYHWKDISTNDLLDFAAWISKLKYEDGKIILDKDDKGKRVMECLGIPHRIIDGEHIIVEKDYGLGIAASLGFLDGQASNFVDKISKAIENSNDSLEAVNKISSVKVMDKSGTYIGARMGRPEKAKIRKLIGSPMALFPVGSEGGKMRSINAALDKGKVTAEFQVYQCKTCSKQTIFSVCESCNNKTEKKKEYRKQQIDINHYFRHAAKRLEINNLPSLIKGVRGTSNEEHIPENLMKGILRAVNDLWVNKDGTIRYDMTEMPITHFKPVEIGTSIEKLRFLGYLKDCYGNDLADGEQIVEIKPQDVILPGGKKLNEEGADEILLRAAKFVDDLLVKVYGLEPFYNIKNKEDLVGELVIGIAPHISAAIAGRIIGFSEVQGCYAHPMWHAAQRRDCLGYNNYVDIQENGAWRVEKIGEFIEGKKPEEKFDKYGTIGKKTPGTKTWSNPGKGEVLEITKHQPSDMMKIYLEDGKGIELTSNHKVFIKGKRMKKVRDISIGDKLTVCYKRDIDETDIDEIFLPQIFKERGDIMLRNLRGYLMHFEDLDKNSNFYQRDSYPIKFVNEFLAKYGKSLEDLPRDVTIAVKRDNVELPLSISLNKTLLEVIGLYISEGYLRKNDSKKGFYQISIAGNEGIKNKVKEVFYSHFKLKPSYENRDSVVFSSRIVYELFKEYLGLGDRAKTKRIPALFLNLKKEKIAALLRGYFEGDGSVSLSDIRVTCDTVSEGLKHDLSFVLSRFGIYTKFYEYEKEPGPKVREFYVRKKRSIPKFNITKIIILSNFVKTFKQIGFISQRKNDILDKLCQQNPRGTRIDLDDDYAYPKVVRVEQVKEDITYCFNVAPEHNFFANDVLVKNCDGDENCVILLMDALLNFSRKFISGHRGATQDAPLLLVSQLIPTEVDDMVFHLDVGWEYPLELYHAAMAYKEPGEVKIEQIISRLGTEKQYEGMGFTNHVSSINMGVNCSAYKTIPTMREKVLGQMKIAEKIRAVDQSDVARLIIERHFIRDIRGNLRKFTEQQFRCVSCNEKYRRVPLAGRCVRCNGNILFTVAEGGVVKYLEPSLELAEKYELPAYLRQVLELTKRRIESVFGRDTERQASLNKWFIS